MMEETQQNKVLDAEPRITPLLKATIGLGPRP